MENQNKKDKSRTMTHKIILYIQRIKWEKRRKKREEIREKVVVLQKERNMSTMIEVEDNPPELSDDRQERGVDEDLSPMEEDLCVEKSRDLQVTIAEPILLHSPSHLT